MHAADDFNAMQHASELTGLRVYLMAVFHRAAIDEPGLQGVRIELETDGFGLPFVSVELVGQGGQAVGGFTL